MPTIEHLAGQWREWRHARVADLTRPYGWTALVAQYWLEDGDSGVKLDLLPGLWSVERGAVIYTPVTGEPNLSVNGEYPTHPVEIIPGRNQSAGHGNSVPVYFGDSEVETIVRTNEQEATIYAVRVRDPKESARKRERYASLAAFEYDPKWRVPAVFTPDERVDFEAPTVEAGVRETSATIGHVSLEIDGRSISLVVKGKDAPEGLRPSLHLRDTTAGDSTYAAGRILRLDFAEGTEPRIDIVDFNYLVALPCAFTNYVTCPLAPAENVLDFAITAGEKRPDSTIERISTYSPASVAI